MIRAEIKYFPDIRVCSLKVTGHAEQAENGKDIVCASASILAYTVAQVVSTMENQGTLQGAPRIELNEGDASIIIRCKDDSSYLEAKHTFYVAKTGYELLMANYPQYVEVITDGEA